METNNGYEIRGVRKFILALVGVDGGKLLSKLKNVYRDKRDRKP